MSRLPLRSQLVALLVATTAVVVLVTGMVGAAALRGYLLDQVDTQLAESLAPRDMPHGGRGMPPGHRFPAPTSYLAALYDASGTLVGQEGLAAGDGGPELPALDAASVARLDDGPFTVPAVNGDDRWRVQVQALPAAGTRVVAVPLGGVDATVRRLLLILGLVGLVALAAAGVLAWLGVRRSLRPLTEVEQVAERIAGGDLSVRVPPSDPRTEVGSLAASFNSMVDRFEQAFRAQQSSEAAARTSEGRMRRFVGDASHELRTPLTSIRGFAELYRQGAVVDEEQLKRVMRRIEDEGARMGLLVEDLLLLARLDQQRPLLHEPVDLRALAADVVHDAQASSPDADIALDEGAGAAVVLGDDARLRQVVGNLVANAVTHTPPGTHVRVAVRREGSDVLVEVRDDGPGMPEEVTRKAFERFFRADASRSRSGSGATSGSGLGLSIVAGLVEAHGGSVSVDSAEGVGSTFRVRLPAAPGLTGSSQVRPRATTAAAPIVEAGGRTGAGRAQEEP